MSKRTIKTISFLISEQRTRVEVTRYGKFKIPIHKRIGGKYKVVDKLMTPREVLNIPQIREADPFLTLETGEKLRVFQGGDPSQMIVEADALLLKHEGEFKKRNNSLRSKMKETMSIDEYLMDDLSDYYGC